MRPLSLSLLLAGLVACASAPRGFVDPSAPTSAPVRLTHAPRAPEIDRLLEDFYGGALTLDETHARVADVLSRHPTSGPAHEVAAWTAVLDGDPHRAWWHWLRAAADLDGATELYLAELWGYLPRSEEDATLALLTQLAEHHPRPEARAAAARGRANILYRHGEIAAAQAALAPAGFIHDWLVVGPFDNDQGKGFLATYPPEARIDLASEMPGRVVPVRWRKLDPANIFGMVPIGEVTHPSEFSVAYVATFIHSDGARPVTLRLTSSTAVRVFVNDALVASEEHVSKTGFDNVRALVTLKAGWNKLLVKSAHRSGYWYLGARITDDSGAPAAGVRAVAALEPYTPSAATDSRVTYLPAWVDELAPASRKGFVTSRMLAGAGQTRLALEPLQQLLSEHPKTLVTRYFAALAYWDNDELGATIDLLDQGVRARVPAFLIKRARYYAQKHLYERAQGDLLAALALPGGERMRAAEVDLAEMYRQREWLVERCLALGRVARKWPDDADALFELGGCLDARDLDERAADVYERALALEPGDGTAIDRVLSFARRRSQLGRARTLLERKAALFPMSPGPLVELGELARRREAVAEAQAHYRQAAALCPGGARAHYRLGEIAFEAGRRDEALREWRLALDRDPNSSMMAQRVESLAPTRLGLLDKYVPTDEDIDRALSMKVTPHPASQTILRLDHEAAEINADGGARRVVTQVIEVANEQGRDQAILQKLHALGQPKILQAYALSKHGERQDASSIRGNDVRFRNLEVGSRVVLQYIDYSPPEHFLPNHYAASWKFESVAAQHEDSRWVILTAKDQKLNVDIEGQVELKELDDGDRHVRVFSARAVPPLTVEMFMPPMADVLRQVHVSTVPSWDEYVRWERALLADALRPDHKIEELARRLAKDSSGPREKLDKLYHYVAQDVRYQQDYENTIAGVRPHAPSSVLERGYGDCKDKALMLIQLLRVVGVQARFAILRTTRAGKLHRTVPNQQFNHAIVYVPKQPGLDEARFVDATATDLDVGSLRGDDQGATSLVLDLDTGAYEFIDIPFEAPASNLEAHQIRIEMKSPTEAHARDDISAHGTMGMMLRHLLRNRGVARKLLANLATMLFSGATLKDLSAENGEDTWHPIVLHLDLDVSNSIQMQGERFRLTPAGTFPLASAVSLVNRETPLWFGEPDKKTFDVEAQLPEGYAAVRVPSELSVAHRCFTLERHARSEGKKVVVHLEYERRCTTVAIADYSEFREVVQRAQRQFQDEIVFAKAATPATTVRHLERIKKK